VRRNCEGILRSGNQRGAIKRQQQKKGSKKTALDACVRMHARSTSVQDMHNASRRALLENSDLNRSLGEQKEGIIAHATRTP
jgi:cytochrome c553